MFLFALFLFRVLFRLSFLSSCFCFWSRSLLFKAESTEYSRKVEGCRGRIGCFFTPKMPSRLCHHAALSNGNRRIGESEDRREGGGRRTLTFLLAQVVYALCLLCSVFWFWFLICSFFFGFVVGQGHCSFKAETTEYSRKVEGCRSRIGCFFTPNRPSRLSLHAALSNRLSNWVLPHPLCPADCATTCFVEWRSEDLDLPASSCCVCFVPFVF